MTVVAMLLLALLLLFLNAFFVLAEFGAVKTRATQVEAMEDRGELRAKTLRLVLDHLDEYLSVCQVGITFASIGLGFVGEPAFARLAEPVLGSSVAAHSVAIVTSYVLVSFLHVVIGEQVPKLVAIRNPEASALLVARPLRIFRALFYPPLVLLNGATAGVLRLLGVGSVGEDHLPGEDEVRIILASSQRQGNITFRRLLLLENVFDFGTVRVRDAMIPRDQVAALRLDFPWEKNRAILESTRRSRYPVLEGDPPHPVGILHVKDLVYRRDLDEGVDLRPLLRRAPSAAPDDLIEDVLADLQQRRRVQMVMVQDPQKGFVGIITMEDIIEEIVGVIEDEFETEPALRLADCVNERRIVLDVAARTLPEAVAEILRRVPRSELPATPEWIRDAVLERERTMPTYLGRGLGVPHARLDGLSGPCILLGRSAEGIRYGQGDQAVAQVIFLLLTASNAPRDQLRLLARIARLRENEVVWEQLLEATTIDGVMEAIRGEALVAG